MQYIIAIIVVIFLFAHAEIVEIACVVTLFGLGCLGYYVVAALFGG